MKITKKESKEAETSTALEHLHTRSLELLERGFEAFFTRPLYLNMFEEEEVKIKEKGGRYELKAHLPGLKKGEIEVAVEDGLVTIRGQRSHEAEHKKAGATFYEAGSETYHRYLELPGAAQSKGAKATYKNGVLTVSLAKDRRGMNEAGKITVH
jgi:HSP20 family molecular chaperone IbpA